MKNKDGVVLTAYLILIIVYSAVLIWSKMLPVPSVMHTKELLYIKRSEDE